MGGNKQTVSQRNLCQQNANFILSQLTKCILLRVFQHRVVQRKSKASWIGGTGETKEGSQDKEDGSHVA